VAANKADSIPHHRKESKMLWIVLGIAAIPAAYFIWIFIDIIKLGRLAAYYGFDKASMMADYQVFSGHANQGGYTPSPLTYELFIRDKMRDQGQNLFLESKPPLLSAEARTPR
jgi:hypothetical protein